MKKGMARRGKLSAPWMTFAGRAISGMSITRSITMLAMPRQKTMGTPKMVKKNRMPRKS